MEDKMKKVKIVVNIIEGIAKTVGEVINNMEKDEKNKPKNNDSND
ncbi:MAG: hypothetical protein AB7W47_12185 [Calditrichaceae bacterium]